MGNAWAWVKEHPLMIAAIVGAIVLVVFFARSGSSAPVTAVVPSGPSDAQVAAGNQLQMAQLEAQARVFGIQAGLEQAREELGTRVAISQIEANTARYQTEVQGDIQQSGIAAQTLVATRGLQTQEFLGEQVTQQNLHNVAAQVNMAAITADTYRSLAEYQAETTIASFETQRDIQMGSYDRDISIARISANTSSNIAGSQAKAATESSKWGALGAIGGAIATALAFI